MSGKRPSPRAGVMPWSKKIFLRLRESLDSKFEARSHVSRISRLQQVEADRCAVRYHPLSSIICDLRRLVHRHNQRRRCWAEAEKLPAVGVIP